MSEYSSKGIQFPAFRSPVIITHVFDRDAITRGDVDAFMERFSPERLTPDELRRGYNSLVIQLRDFDAQTVALYEIPEARAFMRALHKKWHYGFFFLNIPKANLNSYLLCQLSQVTVERRRGTSEPNVMFKRNELFQLVGHNLDPLEQACERVQFSPDVFRARARLILKLFGFLKPDRF